LEKIILNKGEDFMKERVMTLYFILGFLFLSLGVIKWFQTHERVVNVKDEITNFVDGEGVAYKVDARLFNGHRIVEIKKMRD
jgi:hypothetical protein